MLLIAQMASADTGLIWPDNTALRLLSVSPDEHGAMGFQWEDPASDGLPMFGPSGAGVTYIWQYKPAGDMITYSSSGPWRSRCDGGFHQNPPGYTTINYQPFYGFTNYPTLPRSTSTDHEFEISTCDSDCTGAQDWTTTVDGPPHAVVDEKWYTQGGVAIKNGDNSKTQIFYVDLPSTDDADVLIHENDIGYADTPPPDECMTIGDAPWMRAFDGSDGQIDKNESLQGIFRGLKIFDVALSEEDMLTEAENLDDNSTHSTGGSGHLWFSNVDMTPDDISDKSGNGNDPTWRPWVGTEYKPTLYVGPSTDQATYEGVTLD